MKTIFVSLLSTPLGELGVFADSKAIFRIEFTNMLRDEALINHSNKKENDLTQRAKQQLEQYFAGERTVFDLPLAPQGTPFRQQTWQALQKIPFGETRYYAQQAELMNNKKAVRAVGAANGANPIAIVIPCHRVIGKNGSLTGYAGGLDRKAWLLNFEQKTLQNKQVFTLK
ncbi:MAG: methylated-DNA--[protein]-cysteine S-methyltransferase [Colwellia sp.]|nr:methylated-DNA--[protein]-cysteine S-methyltransferase [Colwellia sp.]MCW8865489.1 methylated-DNA--[protein]-cysteine S-methyltransferase [Colwellia sp.]MCW9080713.1 methylated-DNA--[protein]-cysteine S-methyltransferase [Colwellia sp.]